jgi:hypothetical protein
MLLVVHLKKLEARSLELEGAEEKREKEKLEARSHAVAF